MKKNICLDHRFSTTRNVVKEKSDFELQQGKFNTHYFLPEDDERKHEGGLRTQGYFKKSYDNLPLISIVTAVFNGEQYLEATIQSVLFQTYDNVEYIIIDGRSTDDTLNIVKKYEDKIDYWVSEHDNGMYDALSKGFSVCTGDIVAYINSDDLYHQSAFTTVVDVLNRHKDIFWLTGMYVFYNQSGQITSVDYPWGYSQIGIQQGLYGAGGLPFIQQESTFWKKEMLDFVDMNTFKSFKLAGDYYLWKKFSEVENLYLVKSCLGGFRKHGNQLSTDMTKYMEEFNKIRDIFSKSWRLKVLVFRLLKLLPNKIKQRYSPNLVYYDYQKECWVKNNEL